MWIVDNFHYFYKFVSSLILTIEQEKIQNIFKSNKILRINNNNKKHSYLSE